MRETCEAFGVAYAKITPRAEKGRHFIDEFFLCLFVEITHYISTENEIKKPFEGIGIL